MAFPEVINKSPLENEKGIGGDALVSFDIYDADDDLVVDSLLVYINGDLAFSGPDVFHSPYNGPLSLITVKEIGGTEGYNVVVNYTGEYISNTNISIRVYVEDAIGNITDDTWYFDTGNRIITIEPSLYEFIFDVSFEQPFLINSAVIEPANYIFTKGMYARKAQVLSTSTVRLWVELFNSNQSFSLSVSPDILDVDGKSIPNSYNKIDFSPFVSLADISNFNGRIKTWRDMYVVEADRNCIYLGGSKGIDVFNKKNGCWAQIFNNENKINSMFVANFGIEDKPWGHVIFNKDYVFTEKNPPYLFNVSPADGSIAPYNSTILFCVGDEELAVDPTALKVFVNNILAFNGESGGWANGYSGFIEVHYKYLEVAIKPKEPFGLGEVVKVRVVAKDLVSNILDTNYSYQVTTAPVEMVGWGFAKWGRSDFGYGIDNEDDGYYIEDPVEEPGRGFITEWTVSGDETDRTITLPLTDNGVYDCTVYWGDGDSSIVSSFSDVNRIHTYDSDGVYEVEIKGESPGWSFYDGGVSGDELKITDIIYWGDPEHFGGFSYLEGGFGYCTNIKSTGEGKILAKNDLTDVSYLFEGCSNESFTTITTGLFDNCLNLSTYGFYYTFCDCGALTTIPVGLFDNNISVSDYGFFNTFAYCYNLTTVPVGLFDNNVNVSEYGFYSTFQECISLETVPENLFRHNINATSFFQCFDYCEKLQLNKNIFYSDGEQSTRFLNKSMNFISCFNRTSFTGTQGEAPDLWACNFGTGTVLKINCFYGDGNSEVSLSNYNDIPSEWID